MIELDVEKNAEPSGNQPGIEPSEDKWDEDELHARPITRKLWDDWQGKAVLTCGVVLPAVFLGLFGGICFDRICMLLIKHPVETIVECMLAVFVPVGNFLVWRAVCAKDTRSAMRRGIQNGLAIGGSLLGAVISIAAILLGRATIFLGQSATTFTEGFVLIAVIFLVSFATGIYLMLQLRNLREFKSARMRTVIYSIAGIILSILGLAGAEASSMYMRIAELMAFGGTTHDEQQRGLKMLRSMNPERDLNLECADPRTVGLPGLFIPINNATQKQLYFAAVGKPFQYDKSTDLSTFSDDYLRRHVVGASIPELSLVRSGMDGAVNPDTLSSTINWTFVFKNTAYEDKEARAELSLPPGAVISDVTVWQDGQPRSAAVTPSGKAPASGNWTDLGHTTPAVVSDLGRGRTLLHCYPVPAQDELKVRLSIAMPLKLDLATEASLALPRFIDTNFTVKGDHALRLRSSDKLELAGLAATQSPTGEKILNSKLKEGELTGLGLTVTASRKPTFGPIAFADPKVPSRYLVQTIKRTNVTLPNHLIVVLDGSQSVKDKLSEIKEGLASLPQNINASLMVATDWQPGMRDLAPLKDSLNKLNASEFDGGQDNLQAVVNAASTAGETKNGAVLWIHGPQPTVNKELYVMAPYTQTPSFFELSLDNSVTDGNEFFKNHREIGPFTPVSRNGSISHDLKRFISKWQPGGVEFIVHTDEVNKRPECRFGSLQQAQELASLHSNETCQKLINTGNYSGATQVAVQHRLVTPVSSAIVLSGSRQQQSIYRYAAQSAGVGQATPEVFNNTSTAPTDNFDAGAPALQGANNGTIGPQGTDATFVTGVNTAGTVRVNNLANLEALLNVIANGFEILGVVFGISLLATVFVNQSAARKFLGSPTMGPLTMVGISLTVIVVGLAAPGMINWLVASARDANLFS